MSSSATSRPRTDMALQSLGLIGFGNIARLMVSTLAEQLPSRLTRCDVLMRPGTSEERIAAAREACNAMCAECNVYVDLDALRQAAPELVIECAGHEAVSNHAIALLEDGVETIVTSVGALGDEELHQRLIDAAQAGGTRLVVPSGAIGALDIVAGLKHAGIESVSYRSRKPPGSWSGTPAEQELDLDPLTSATTFYEGSARAAVLDYPKNANVAAALSLAGIGFDETRVELIADPAVSGNRHEFDVESVAGSVAVCIEGRASENNPKTSLPTVYSLVREVMNRVGPIAV